KRLFSGHSDLDLVILGRQDVGDAFRMIEVVVDDENARLHAAILSSATRGSLMSTVVPMSISLVNCTVPPCCSTICFTVGSPRPVPKLLVLNSGSNTRDKTSGAIPGPVSLMVMRALFPTEVETLM